METWHVLIGFERVTLRLQSDLLLEIMTSNEILWWKHFHAYTYLCLVINGKTFFSSYMFIFSIVSEISLVHWSNFKYKSNLWILWTQQYADIASLFLKLNRGDLMSKKKRKKKREGYVGYAFIIYLFKLELFN